MEQKIEQHKNTTVSDEELLSVMADFLEMGYVENIVAMFKQESRYYDWTGELLADERFAVRLGVSVLFEYLTEDCPDDVGKALPSLARQLENPTSWIRGEVLSVLGIIGTQAAMDYVKEMVDDPDSQVAEVARDILQDAG
jgi:hypothetical protein